MMNSNCEKAIELKGIYSRRFEANLNFRKEMWRVLCQCYFQKFIPDNATVMEVAAGYCEFINQINCQHKIAVDLNPDTIKYANSGIRVITASSTNLSDIESGSVDIAFTSNFFEHLTRDDIKKTIQEVRRVLNPCTGRFIVLQPNIRFCARDYWMFFDHITPLDDRSLTEVLEINGFIVTKKIARFLPYSTQSRLPKSSALVKLYLKVPIIWRLLGKQSLLIADVK